MKQFEMDEELMNTLENVTHVAMQACDLMMTAIRQQNPEAANDIAELVTSGKARLLLVAGIGGLELIAVDDKNQPIGGPLLAYRRGAPEWVN